MTPAQFRRHLSDPMLSPFAHDIDPECPLDRWISYAVKVLRDAGVETYESCQGGPGHSFPEPTVRFSGGQGAGYKAAAVAVEHGLPITSVRRFWRMLDGELEGPNWEMTFRSADLRKVQKAAEAAGVLDVESGPGRLAPSRAQVNLPTD